MVRDFCPRQQLIPDLGGTSVANLIFRWSRSSSNSNEGEEERETTFRARFHLENATHGGVHTQVSEGSQHHGGGAAAAFVMAVTSVDQAWGARLVQGWPDIGPQVSDFLCHIWSTVSIFVPHKL